MTRANLQSNCAKRRTFWVQNLTQTGEIATRSAEAGYQTGFYRIATGDNQHGNAGSGARIARRIKQIPNRSFNVGLEHLDHLATATSFDFVQRMIVAHFSVRNRTIWVSILCPRRIVMGP